jgi:Nitrile hydratase, alpha chain
VVENTADTVYLVVPTKPDGEQSGQRFIRIAGEQQGPAAKLVRALIKASRDEAFKKRLLANAVTTLGEHGVSVPDGKTIRVVENTAETLHVVLPAKPTQEELSDEQLDQVAGGLVGEIVEGLVDLTLLVTVLAWAGIYGGGYKRDPGR